MLMRLLCMTLLTLPVSGCVSETPAPVDPSPVICVGTRAARADLAAALADTQDARALMAGAALIDLLDAGCAGDPGR